MRRHDRRNAHAPRRIMLLRYIYIGLAAACVVGAVIGDVGYYGPLAAFFAFAWWVGRHWD